MIIGIGSDIIRVSRVRKLAERYPDRIGKKIFTTDELAYCLKKSDAAVSLAGRFAAKEAVMKALGTGWRSGVRFIDIEIVRAPSGRPSIVLHGKVEEIAASRGVSTIHLSISHDGDMAMATAIAEGM